ncbi:MAG: acyl-CoA dehydrogenase domain-containing protein, partial [Nodosilinea sp.]
ALGRLDTAHRLSQSADAIHRRLKEAVHIGQLATDGQESLETLAHRVGLLTQAEWDQLRTADQARKDAIQVDAFSFEEYQTGTTVEPRFHKGRPVGANAIRPEELGVTKQDLG